MMNNQPSRDRLACRKRNQSPSDVALHKRILQRDRFNQCDSCLAIASLGGAVIHNICTSFFTADGFKK